MRKCSYYHSATSYNLVFMSKIHRMHGLFDWLSQYIQFIKLIVHLLSYYNVLIHIQRALSHMLVITPLVSSNPSCATKHFINVFSENQSKIYYFLKLCTTSVYKGKETFIHIKLSHF